MMTEDEFIEMESNFIIGDARKDIDSVYICLSDDGKYDVIYVRHNNGELKRFKRNPDSEMPYEELKEKIDALLEKIGATEENRNFVWFMERKINNRKLDFSRIDQEYILQQKFRNRLDRLSATKVGTEPNDINRIYICVYDSRGDVLNDDDDQVDSVYVEYNNGKVEKITNVSSIPRGFFYDSIDQFFIYVTDGDMSKVQNAKRQNNEGIDFNELERRYSTLKEVRDKLAKYATAKIGDKPNNLKSIYIQTDEDDKISAVYVTYNNGTVDRVVNDGKTIPDETFFKEVTSFLAKVGANAENANSVWFKAKTENDLGVDFNKLSTEYFYQKNKKESNRKKLGRYVIKDVIDTKGTELFKVVLGNIAAFGTGLGFVASGMIGIGGLCLAVTTVADIFYSKHLKKEIDDIKEFNIYGLGLEPEDIKKGKR